MLVASCIRLTDKTYGKNLIKGDLKMDCYAALPDDLAHAALSWEERVFKGRLC